MIRCDHYDTLSYDHQTHHITLFDEDEIVVIPLPTPPFRGVRPVAPSGPVVVIATPAMSTKYCILIKIHTMFTLQMYKGSIQFFFLPYMSL